MGFLLRASKMPRKKVNPHLLSSMFTHSPSSISSMICVIFTSPLPSNKQCRNDMIRITTGCIDHSPNLDTNICLVRISVWFFLAIYDRKIGCLFAMSPMKPDWRVICNDPNGKCYISIYDYIKYRASPYRKLMAIPIKEPTLGEQPNPRACPSDWFASIDSPHL